MTIRNASDQRLYWIWKAMRQRCSNPNNKYFHRYGGRGIRICQRWDAFGMFKADMGAGFDAGLSLDRVDPDGDYCPENCRWTTLVIQNRNTSHSISKSGHKGVFFDKKRGAYRVHIYVDRKQIYLGTFDDVSAAIEKRKQAEAYYWR